MAGTKAELVRGENFNGYLLRVNGSSVSATLQDIVIDGNSENNTSIEDSLIYVNGGTLNIGNGAVLRNNKIKDKPNTATRGGAIKATSATVNMTGGSVEGNQANFGGGICLSYSTLNISGGCVQKNLCDNKYTFSAGGGILAYVNSTINISDLSLIHI